MKKLCLFAFYILIVPGMLWAESFTATVTEVDASALSNLARTCFYYCLCKNANACACSNWILAGCYQSDDGNGGDAIQHTWDVKLYTADLPATMRYTATSVTTTGNESTRGVTDNTYTFTQ